MVFLTMLTHTLEVIIYFGYGNLLNVKFKNSFSKYFFIH